MQINQIIKIKPIPINIKLKVFKYIHCDLYIVGYKKVKSVYCVPIIQLYDYNRIWLLPKEIK